jgi:hypothetical protein
MTQIFPHGRLGSDMTFGPVVAVPVGGQSTAETVARGGGMTAGGAERPVLVAAIRDLVDAARLERAVLSFDDPDREFYLGVERAAEEVLHPERVGPDEEHWLSRESRSFREGYSWTETMILGALTAAEPPLRFRLPRPGAVAQRSEPDQG